LTLHRRGFYTYKDRTTVTPAHAMHYPPICHLTDPISFGQKPQQEIPLLFIPVVLLGVVADVQAKAVGVEVDLVVALLEDLGNGLGVVELTQVDV
jgi:hypothetical protein